MFKILNKGRRNAGSGGVPKAARVDARSMGSVTDAPVPRTVAFQPETPQEHAFDANSPRLQGLEQGH